MKMSEEIIVTKSQLNPDTISITRTLDTVVKLIGSKAIAEKIVPEGQKYWIIKESDLPSEYYEFRDAWVLDEDSLGPAHGVGGESNSYSKEIINKLDKGDV